MNVLESPLEALAFNYVSFGFFTLVNNLWTWIAFVTAAVSFWRIRVLAGGGAFPTEESPPLDVVMSSNALSPPPPPEEEKPSLSPSPIPSPPQETSAPSRLVEEMSATRGPRKFALYYEDNGADGELTAVEEWDGVELTATEKWFESWERALRTRRGESETGGWYRYQDLTELNGNVVRLWDGHGGYRSRSECESKRLVLW